MAKGITEIYNDVLSILPYSLTGHINLDEKLNKFYEKLVETNYIKHSDKFTFLCSALLRLPSINKQQNETNKRLQDWELNSFKKIFYKTFVEGDKEEVLSFYFYLLKWAASKFDKESLSTSELLSKFFVSDLDFRVGIISDLKIVRPNVKFDKRRSLFEINIPASLFRVEGYEDPTHLKLILNKIWFGKDKYIKKSNSLGRLYELNIPSNESHFDEVFNLLFDESKINNIIEIIAVDYLKEFAKFKLYNTDETLFKQIAYCSICISFLCFYYECYVEYMLSIAKVEYKHSIRSGQVVPIPEYRNIGGLIIGYSNNTEITSEERAIFNVVSDRLASVIAGQYLHDEYEEISTKGKGYGLLKTFWDYSLNILTHHDSNEEKILEALSVAEKHIESLYRVLSQETCFKIVEYITNLKYSQNKKDYIATNGANIKTTIRFKPKEWASKLKTEFSIEVGTNIDSLNEYIFCDMEYLNAIIRSSITNSRTHNNHNNNLSVALEFLMFKVDDTETTDLSEANKLQFCLEDNGGGCDLNTITLNATTYGNLKKMFRPVLNAFGEIELHSKNNMLAFSPEKNEIIRSDFNAGFRTIIKLHKNETQNINT